MAKRRATRTGHPEKKPRMELSWPARSRKRAYDLVMQLMEIPGKTGEESLVADYVRRALREAGAPNSAFSEDSAHHRTPNPGQLGNLVVTIPGNVRAPRRMFSAHMDTVPICVGSQPVRHNRIVRSADDETGLGADDRAGVAVILQTALEILRTDRPHPPLTFCFFVQEEGGLHGSRCMSVGALRKPWLAFNWDGGSPYKLTIGATGGYRMLVDIRGIASHAGGAPECGVSAISVAALAIADLQRNGWHGLIQKPAGVGTSNVGFLHGGEATNVVTDRVAVKIEARSHDPKFRKQIVKQIERAFRAAVKEVRNVAGAVGKLTIDGQLDYESFVLDRDEPCVREAAQAVRDVGGEPVYAIANGGVDANWTTAHGIPTVSLGCGQKNQHMTSEMLDLDQFEDACRIANRLAAHLE